MKIDHKEIKRLYQAYLTDKSPENRKKCPLPEKIFELFRSNTLESTGKEILDHILQCSYCSKDFQFIFRILKEEKNLLNELEILHKSSNEHEEEKKKESKPIFLHFSCKYAFMLLGIAVLAAVFNLNKPDKYVYRGSDYNAIRLLSPSGTQYSKSNLHFEWEKVENADYYLLEIFNDSLYPIWKSKKIRTTWTTLPNCALNKLASSEVYYWMVTAFLPSDRILDSKLQKFKIKY